MGSNIKQAIMDTARNLFSERGFQDTSMRDIAAVLHISVGNLTYHFKKKEDLIEAILLDDHKEYQKAAIPVTLKEFDLLLRRSTMQRKSRPYYFKHFVQLAQTSPVIYEMQASVLKDLNDVLVKTFQNFADNGIFTEESRREANKLADIIMTLMAHGLHDFRHMTDAEKDIYWLECVWCIVTPRLSVRGQTEYQSLLAQKDGP